jgi:hypothetical protein
MGHQHGNIEIVVAVVFAAVVAVPYIAVVVVLFKFAVFAGLDDTCWRAQRFTQCKQSLPKDQIIRINLNLKIIVLFTAILLLFSSYSFLLYLVLVLPLSSCIILSPCVTFTLCHPIIFHIFIAYFMRLIYALNSLRNFIK